ncbi:hypothetical protein QUB70_10090 [Microcoleus sp. A003_D6]|uniref:hypothetical protein n=1 Tax=Microcoleus sp. A003_D6 TaxID=3055266 RepID=UPI002FCF88AE
MLTSENESNINDNIREAFADKLGLSLSDAEIILLRSNKTLSFEQLAQNHSLTELGTALIRLDAVNQLQETEREFSLKRFYPDEGDYCITLGKKKCCFTPPGRLED